MSEETLDQAKLIEMLEQHVTCAHWFTCRKCKTFKMTIAFIKELGEMNEQHKQD